MGIDEYLSANGIGTFSLGVGEWFLGCIILCYLVYPFLYRAHKKNKVLTFVIMTTYYIAFNLNYHKFNFTKINENIDEVQELTGLDTRKVYANVYIDDKNCPADGSVVYNKIYRMCSWLGK